MCDVQMEAMDECAESKSMEFVFNVKWTIKCYIC